MDKPKSGYFQLQQAVEVSSTFAKHGVEFMFIGKSGAILLGYPSTTQDVDLFPKKSKENGRRILAAIVELGFASSGEIEQKILAGADYWKISRKSLKNGSAVIKKARWKLLWKNSRRPITIRFRVLTRF